MIITYLFGFGKGGKSVAQALERGLGGSEEGGKGRVGGLGESGIFEDDEVANLIVKLGGEGAIEDAVETGFF